MSSRRQRGFTMVELMIVVVIVAVLLVLSLPSYQQQLRDTRRNLAGAELLDVMMRQEQYFIDHKQYAESLSDLGFLANPYAIDSEGEEVSVLDEQRIYLVSLVTTEYAYTLNATPLLGQTKDRLCGTLSLDSRGIKLATGDGHVRECW